MREVFIDGVRYVPCTGAPEATESLGAMLLRLRRQRRLTVKAAARGIGTSVGNLFALENGSWPSLRTAVAIADFYGINIEQLGRCVRAARR